MGCRFYFTVISYPFSVNALFPYLLKISSADFLMFSKVITKEDSAKWEKVLFYKLLRNIRVTMEYAILQLKKSKCILAPIKLPLGSYKFTFTIGYGALIKSPLVYFIFIFLLIYFWPMFPFYTS